MQQKNGTLRRNPHPLLSGHGAHQGQGAAFLSTGRPRLPAEVVFLFMVLRGRYNSLTDSEAVDRFTESVSVFMYLANRGIQKPGRTTLLENVNAVSNRTREMIWDAQILSIIAEGLDDGDGDSQ